jgi:hypothetical protein
MDKQNHLKGKPSVEIDSKPTIHEKSRKGKEGYICPGKEDETMDGYGKEQGCFQIKGTPHGKRRFAALGV